MNTCSAKIGNSHSSFFSPKYTNYYDHTYVPEEDSVIWSLDYEKYSDFDDVAGHWHLEDHPSKPVSVVCDASLLISRYKLTILSCRAALECFMPVISKHEDLCLDQS